MGIPNWEFPLFFSNQNTNILYPGVNERRRRRPPPPPPLVLLMSALVLLTVGGGAGAGAGAGGGRSGTACFAALLCFCLLVGCSGSRHFAVVLHVGLEENINSDVSAAALRQGVVAASVDNGEFGDCCGVHEVEDEAWACLAALHDPDTL